MMRFIWHSYKPSLSALRYPYKQHPTTAKSLQINEKTVAVTYQRFAKTLPTWQQWIEHNFLSAEMKKQYSDLIIAKLAHW